MYLFSNQLSGSLPAIWSALTGCAHDPPVFKAVLVVRCPCLVHQVGRHSLVHTPTAYEKSLKKMIRSGNSMRLSFSKCQEHNILRKQKMAISFRWMELSLELCD